MVTACIPTRGVIYARTIESILANKPDEIIFAKEMPVPDAYNYLVDKALENPLTSNLLFVDDDMYLPPGTLDRLINLKADVAFCDYPLEKGNVTKYHDGELLFSGMGCVLVKRHVFDDIRFRTHVGYKFPTMETLYKDPDKHGGQDVDFFVQCKQKGYNIVQGGTVGHLRSNLPHLKGNNTSYKVREL